jgi:hypothetical protein
MLFWLAEGREKYYFAKANIFYAGQANERKGSKGFVRFLFCF